MCCGIIDLITGGIENEFDMRHAPFIRTCFENHRLALAKQFVQVRVLFNFLALYTADDNYHNRVMYIDSIMYLIFNLFRMQWRFV